MNSLVRTLTTLANVVLVVTGGSEIPDDESGTKRSVRTKLTPPSGQMGRIGDRSSRLLVGRSRSSIVQGQSGAISRGDSQGVIRVAPDSLFRPRSSKSSLTKELFQQLARDSREVGLSDDADQLIAVDHWKA